MESLGHRGVPRYAGEDTRLTSTRELTGWYFYGWAAEVFVVCGVGSFLPITLEQLARDRGVLLSDRTTPCDTGLDIAPPPGLNGTIPAISAVDDESGQCIIRFLGHDINTASFAMYTFSFSVLVQALIIISMSGAADHGRYRKSLLLGFAFTGAIATMLFLFINSSVYGLGSLLAIIANTGFGASFVLLNSFLPLLVRYHPSIQPHSPPVSPTAVNRRFTEDSLDEDDLEHEMHNSTSALLPDQDVPDTTPKALPSPSAASPELQLSTRISSNGIGLGYVAAVIVQILSVIIVFFLRGSTFSLRLVLFFVGAWWFIFTIPAAVCLRPRPGPPLATGGGGKKRTWLAYLSHAWISLGKTVMRARKLKDVVLFLTAWFLLSDGIATVSGTAILFAKTTLKMKPAALAMINVVVMVSGVMGAVGWNSASRLLGLRPSQTILACLCVFEIIPIYALLGYIPAIKRLGIFGLQQPWEMYPLGAIYGLVMAGLSSYCRSLFGELIPPGSEAAFYALYAITDKGSSVFGPAIVGAITDATGEIRPAFWFLAVLIGLPFPILWFVDVDRGKREGAAMAGEFDGHKTVDDRNYTDDSHDTLDEGQSSGVQAEGSRRI